MTFTPLTSLFQYALLDGREFQPSVSNLIFPCKKGLMDVVTLLVI